MFYNGWSAVVEAFEHDRDNVALVIQRAFNFTAQPVAGVFASLKCGRGEKNNEMRPCPDAAKNDLLKVATGEASVIEEYIEAIMVKTLIDCQRPRSVGATVADENSLFNLFHRTFLSCSGDGAKVAPLGCTLCWATMTQKSLWRYLNTR